MIIIIINFMLYKVYLMKTIVIFNYLFKFLLSFSFVFQFFNRNNNLNQNV
jgi:hypothetical protein